MHFNIEQQGRKSNTNKSVIKLLKSPAIRTLGNLTIFSPKYPDERCDRIKL